MSNELQMDFSSLRPKSVNIKGPDGAHYVLRSASADAAIRYRNASAKAGKWESYKNAEEKDDLRLIGFDNIADSEPTLVSGCLCETEGGREGQVLLKKDGLPLLVPESRIRSWPPEVMTWCFEWIKKNSPGLDKPSDQGEPADPKDLQESGRTSSS